MKLTMLGTGNALVTECYNTCFVIEDEGKYFMVDGGETKNIIGHDVTFFDIQSTKADQYGLFMRLFVCIQRGISLIRMRSITLQ